MGAEAAVRCLGLHPTRNLIQVSIAESEEGNIRSEENLQVDPFVVLAMYCHEQVFSSNMLQIVWIFLNSR